jgi:HD-GYP domain-containing protein (c-di-GMP phosphodiesterase class II)
MPEIDANKMAARESELEERFAKLGMEFFRLLYATLKTASLYEANNNRYISQAKEFRQLVAEVFTEGNKLSFVYRGGYFFLNNFRVALDTSDQEASEYFSEKFIALNIDGFEISHQADSREIDRFIFSFTHFKAGDDPVESFEQLKERLDKLQIENIHLVKISEKNADQPKEIDKNSKARARKVFFQAIGTVQDIISQAKTGAGINLTKTKRVVQGMVDQIIEDEPAMMELTILRDFDNYTYIHSVNVCVLSLILGHHLNLDKRRLSDLGVGALLHDIGKIDLPASLINKTETFDDMDWQQMRMHPVYGVKSIIRTRGTDRSSVRAIATSYEHHISYGGGGYPELLQKRTPCLFAQIVAICDTFNAMTSGRVYHKRRMSGDEVITNMVNRAGKDFNPLLLKVFINVIGVFPVGSVVRLNNDEVAIVSRNNPDNLESPEVKIIADRDGLKDEIKIIDLSKESTDGIKIKSVIDGDKYNIDPANYIDLG